MNDIIDIKRIMTAFKFEERDFQYFTRGVGDLTLLTIKIINHRVILRVAVWINNQKVTAELNIQEEDLNKREYIASCFAELIDGCYKEMANVHSKFVVQSF